jgi:hypothetical protein
MKKKKAAGKSGNTLEMILLLNLQEIVDQLNHWWTHRSLPPEQLTARVISIFKKGDPTVLENFRPISLLETLYKAFAGILKPALQKD